MGYKAQDSEWQGMARTETEERSETNKERERETLTSGSELP